MKARPSHSSALALSLCASMSACSDGPPAPGDAEDSDAWGGVDADVDDQIASPDDGRPATDTRADAPPVDAALAALLGYHQVVELTVAADGGSGVTFSGETSPHVKGNLRFRTTSDGVVAELRVATLGDDEVLAEPFDATVFVTSLARDGAVLLGEGAAIRAYDVTAVDDGFVLVRDDDHEEATSTEGPTRLVLTTVSPPAETLVGTWTTTALSFGATVLELGSCLELAGAPSRLAVTYAVDDFYVATLTTQRTVYPAGDTQCEGIGTAAAPLLQRSYVDFHGDSVEEHRFVVGDESDRTYQRWDVQAADGGFTLTRTGCAPGACEEVPTAVTFERAE